MTLLLERHEVEALLDMPGAIAATETAFREQGQAQTIAQAPLMMRTPNGYFRVVAGGLLGSNLLGARMGVSGRPDNLAALFDADTGAVRAVMPYAFGRFRTGATVALATQLLARSDARVVGLLGSGRNALSLLEGTLCVRDIQTILVYSPRHRDEFAARAQERLGIDVRAVDSTAEAIRSSDILLVATNSREPVFDATDLPAGIHVGSMGIPAELGPNVYRRADLIVLGDKAQERQLHAERALHPLLQVGEAAWDAAAELGVVVCGKAGRTTPEQITVFRESQGGWGDLALAAWVCARAMEQGIGKEVAL
jgi:alanine dehydrogenase